MSRWPWDRGPEAISYLKLGHRTRASPGIFLFPGETSCAKAFGVFLSSPSLSLSLCMFAHSVHVTANTYHLIWEKL